MTAASPLIASADDLLAWSRDPAAAVRLSALAGVACLLVDPARTPWAADDARAAATWVRSLACPVVAVGTHDEALARGCDVIVEDRAEAQRLARAIVQAPLAAATLVQVLRATEHAPVENGLLIESLAYSALQAGPEFHRWRHGASPALPDASADAGPAVIAVRDGDRLRLELNRPSRHNAMSVEMRDALIESLQLALIDDSVRRLEIRGRGRCFSTGGDLDEFGSAPDPVSAHLVRRLALPARLLEACRERATVFVHGACVGSGIEFPSFAARVVAAPDAWFQLPELRYGLIPGAGGCVGINRRIGRQRTAWLALGGKRIDAKTALAWGLVDAIEPGV